MIDAPPTTPCPKCRHYRDGLFSHLCGHPKSVEGYDPIDGRRFLKRCNQVNTDGNCKLFEKKRWWQ